MQTLEDKIDAAVESVTSIDTKVDTKLDAAAALAAAGIEKLEKTIKDLKDDISTASNTEVEIAASWQFIVRKRFFLSSSSAFLSSAAPSIVRSQATSSNFFSPLLFLFMEGPLKKKKKLECGCLLQGESEKYGGGHHPIH